MEDWMYDLPLEAQRQMEEDYFRDDYEEEQRIEICNFIAGSCHDCPLHGECSQSYQTIRDKKEWISIFDEMIHRLENIKESIKRA